MLYSWDQSNVYTTIYFQGAGSALMRRVNCLETMVRGMTRTLTRPLTLKMRTAIHSNTHTAHTIIQKAKLWDVNMITVSVCVWERQRERMLLTSVFLIWLNSVGIYLSIYIYTQVHGRSREQRYLKLADWDYIKECVKVSDTDNTHIPVFGNGDVLSFEDYNNFRERAGVAGKSLYLSIFPPFLLLLRY